MYCTYTQSYCNKLGHLLDDEQLAWNVVEAIKDKDTSMRTKGEKDILEKAKKLKGHNKAKLYKEIAKELVDKPVTFKL